MRIPFLTRKSKLRIVAMIVLALIIAVWVIDKIPFTARIDIQAEPTIYIDGKFVDKTSVTIKGEKTRYLFRDDSFIGEIRIACVEKTGTDGLQAKIRWHGDDELQTLSFYHKGDFFGADNYGLSTSLIMKEDMRNFAFMTTDGKVISTAQLYCRVFERTMEK